MKRGREAESSGEVNKDIINWSSVAIIQSWLLRCERNFHWSTVTGPQILSRTTRSSYGRLHKKSFMRMHFVGPILGIVIIVILSLAVRWSHTHLNTTPWNLSQIKVFCTLHFLCVPTGTYCEQSERKGLSCSYNRRIKSFFLFSFITIVNGLAVENIAYGKILTQFVGLTVTFDCCLPLS